MKTWQATMKSLEASALSSMLPGDAAVEFSYGNLAGFSAHVTASGLEQLLANSLVATVKPVYVLTAHLAQGIPLMHAATYRATCP